MRQKHPETFEQRHNLLKACAERAIPASIMLKHTRQLEGKTEAEKERIAASILAKIEAGEIV